jgi:hypothetical protein
MINLGFIFYKFLKTPKNKNINLLNRFYIIYNHYQRKKNKKLISKYVPVFIRSHEAGWPASDCGACIALHAKQEPTSLDK